MTSTAADYSADFLAAADAVALGRTTEARALVAAHYADADRALEVLTGIVARDEAQHALELAAREQFARMYYNLCVLGENPDMSYDRALAQVAQWEGGTTLAECAARAYPRAAHALEAAIVDLA